jgi:hypothetical protein
MAQLQAADDRYRCVTDGTPTPFCLLCAVAAAPAFAVLFTRVAQMLHAHRARRLHCSGGGSCRPPPKVHTSSLPPHRHSFAPQPRLHARADRQLVQRYRSYMAIRSKMEETAASWTRAPGQ